MRNDIKPKKLINCINFGNLSKLTVDFGNSSILVSLTLDSHFSITSTGLTLTLALFVAGKAAFSDEELKILAKHKEANGREGQALIDFIGPYVFTSMLFFLTGLVSLFGPFLNLNLNPMALLVSKIIYFNILSLGFFSLFNLVITMLNDVYLKAFRK